jgi:putative Mg2+ transporter-C (MgtC) family protein
MNFQTVGVDELLRLVVSIALSCVLAFPLGWERKRHSHADVGLRVFPLVAVGACVYVFVAQQILTGERRSEQADVLQGLMTGIGFVGAGAIIKHSGSVTGLATAAALWTTGAIGAAVAYGFYALAIVLSLMNLFILAITQKLKRRVKT